jgi:hypothetical protein
LTGNSLLLTFNIRQDEEIVRIRTTGKISGTGRMLKQSADTKKVERKRVGSPLNLDLSLNLQ